MTTTGILARYFGAATIVCFGITLATGHPEPFLGAVASAAIFLPFVAWLEGWIE